ncbi:MAG: ubiquitin carboxyl-terminal hydrolase, partial [Verrucomicrobia bacterium]|nr:ubiquitin carboxyl-terminal hydrolase [Verrucomicrobiota bacterium]
APSHVDIKMMKEKAQTLKEQRQAFIEQFKGEKQQQLINQYGSLEHREATKEWHQFEKELQSQVKSYDQYKTKWRFAIVEPSETVTTGFHPQSDPRATLTDFRGFLTDGHGNRDPRIVVECADGPPIHIKSPKVRHESGLAIFGSSSKECDMIHTFYESLEQRSEFGRIVHGHMKDTLTRNEPLALVGIRGPVMPAAPKTYGLCKSTPTILLGNSYKTTVFISIYEEILQPRVFLSHELIHFFVRRVTTDYVSNPLLDLPEYVQKNFMDLYRSEQARLRVNPHPVNSLKWRCHELMNNNLFTMPTLYYHPQQQVGEIFAYGLEYELLFPGSLRRHSPVLADAFDEVLHTGRKQALSSSSIPQRDSQTYFSMSKGAQTISLAELNIAQNLSPLQQVLKCVGNGIKKTLEIGGKGLRIISRPEISIPLTIVFEYDHEQQNSLLKAIFNGFGIWRTSLMSFEIVSAATKNPYIAIALSTAVIGAEVLPDAETMPGKCLPRPEKIKNICGDSPYGQYLYAQTLEQYGYGIIMGHIQKGLRTLNPVRWWNELVKEDLNACIDALCPDPGFAEWKLHRAEEKLAKLETFVEDHLTPYMRQVALELEALAPSSLAANTTNGGSLYIPNMENLHPTPRVIPSDEVSVKEETLRACSLPWEACTDKNSGVTTLTTSFEIPENELALPEDQPLEGAVVGTAYSSNNLTGGSIPKRPSFQELATVTGVHLGPGIGGGGGIVLTLESGAMVTLSTTGNAVITGISAPLTKGFITAAGTGLIYALPVAAVLLGVQMAINARESKTQDHLKKDGKKAEIDLNDAKAQVHQFDHFLHLFEQGIIDPATFVSKVNELSGKLHTIAKNMDKRGDYAEKHKGDSDYYFDAKSKMRQLDKDLHKIAQDAIIRSDFAQKLKEKPLHDLVAECSAFFNKGFLSIHESHQQGALITEIHQRLESNPTLDALNLVDPLAGKPVAISITPPEVARPDNLSVSQLSSERRRHRVREWANDMANAYGKFRTAAENGDLGAMQEAAKWINIYISRTEGAKDQQGNLVNLKDYELHNHKPCRNAGRYYANYITAIRANTKEALTTAENAQKGVVPDGAKLLLTVEQLRDQKVSAASSSYNTGLATFQNPDKDDAERDAAFTETCKAAEALVTLQYKADSAEEDLSIQNLLAMRQEVSQEGGSYTGYQRVRERMKEIAPHVQNLQEATKKLEDPAIKEDKHECDTQYNLALSSAAKLHELGLSEEDLQKLLDKPELAKSYLQWIQSLPTAYRHPVVRHYEDRVLHLFSGPSVRVGLHIFSDLHRYEGYKELKALGWGLSTVHSIAPNAFPAAVNYLVASYYGGETPLVKEKLLQNVVSGVRDNAFTHMAPFADAPLAALTNVASLQEASSLMQSASAIVQLAADVLTYVAGEELAEPINTASTAISSASNLLYNLNLANKVLRAGSLVSKVHELGQGCGTLAMAGFDLYELMATHPHAWGPESDWSYATIVKAKIRQALPELSGHLPENSWYYAGKNIFSTAACSAIATYSDSVSMRGVAGSFGFMNLCHLYQGKYVDDALSAIMMNYRYFRHYLKQDLTDRGNRALHASMLNLRYYLTGGNNTIQDFASSSIYRINPASDSKIRAAAKLFYFEEYVLHTLKEKKNWDAILSKTAISYTDDCTCRLSQLNVDVIESVNTMLSHFSAAEHKMIPTDPKDPASVALAYSYGSSQVVKKISEIEAISRYFDHKFSKFSTKKQEREKEYIAQVKEQIQAIKSKLISNFCIYLAKDQIHVPPLFALQLFDAIPVEERDVLHWLALGTLIQQDLKQHEWDDQVHFQMDALTLFCFKTIVDILDKKKAARPQIAQPEVSNFEDEMRRSCQASIQMLSSSLGENSAALPEEITPHTKSFLQVVEKILSGYAGPVTISKVKERPQELPNIGNSCYINATLQLLLHNPMIIQSLDAIKANVCRKNKTRALPLINALRELSCKAHITHYDLMKFQAAAAQSGLDIQTWQEQDAGEFFGAILDLLSDGNDELKVTVSTTNETLAQEILFDGSILTRTDVSESTEQGTILISLHLHQETDEKNTLFDILQHEFGSCLVEDTGIRRQSSLVGDPAYLYFHIARFTSDTVVSKKDHRPIVLPKDGRIDLAPFFKDRGSCHVYEIVGKMNHMGVMESGHYHCDILKADSEASSQWYHCNDSRIMATQKFTWEDDSDSSAYILALKKSTATPDTDDQTLTDRFASLSLQEGTPIDNDNSFSELLQEFLGLSLQNK